MASVQVVDVRLAARGGDGYRRDVLVALEDIIFGRAECLVKPGLHHQVKLGAVVVERFEYLVFG